MRSMYEYFSNRNYNTITRYLKKELYIYIILTI